MSAWLSAKEVPDLVLESQRPPSVSPRDDSDSEQENVIPRRRLKKARFNSDDESQETETRETETRGAETETAGTKQEEADVNDPSYLVTQPLSQLMNVQNPVTPVMAGSDVGQRQDVEKKREADHSMREVESRKWETRHVDSSGSEERERVRHRDRNRDRAHDERRKQDKERWKHGESSRKHAESRRLGESSRGHPETESEDEDALPSECEDDYLEFHRITKEVENLICEELGGSSEKGRGEIRECIKMGRCKFTRSLDPPPEIQACNPRLKEYQIAGIHWLLTLFKNGFNGLIADDMGLGKSAECICFLNQLYSDKLLREPAVVACPATLLDNWIDEFGKWGPKLRVLKYHGTQTERRMLMRQFATGIHPEDEEDDADSQYDDDEERRSDNENSLGAQEKEPADENDDGSAEDKDAEAAEDMGDEEEDNYYPLEGNVAYHVLVTTHQTLANNFDRQLFFKAHNFSFLVVDEAHSLKNSASLRYQQMNKNVRAPSRLLLTGSPVQNQIGELRNLLTFLNPYRKASFDITNALQYHCALWKAALKREQEAKQKGQAISPVPAKATDTAHPSELSSTAQDATTMDQPQTSDPATPSPEQSPPEESPVIGSASTESGGFTVSAGGKSGAADEPMAESPETDSAVTASAMTETESVVTESAMTESAMTETGTEVEEGKEKTISNPEILFYQQLLAPLILRRLKKEVIQNFPKKTNKIELCDMLPRQQELYDSELRAAKPLLADTTRGKRTRRVRSEASATSSAFIKGLLFRLRRVCNHPLLHQQLFDENKRQEFAQYLKKHVEEYREHPFEKVIAHMADWSDYDLHMEAANHLPALQSFRIDPEEFLNSCKIQRMLEILDEKCGQENERVLIFSQFTTYLNIIQDTLVLHRPDLPFVRLDGGTAVDDRSAMVAAFQAENSDLRVFLLSTKAGGVGLNLTKASTVILMDQDWNPHNDRQAEDRVHRLGQTSDVTIYRLCCRHSFEETVLSCCKRKLELDEAFGGVAEALPLEILDDIIKNVRQLNSAAKVEEEKRKEEERNEKKRLADEKKKLAEEKRKTIAEEKKSQAEKKSLVDESKKKSKPAELSNRKKSAPIKREPPKPRAPRKKAEPKKKTADTPSEQAADTDALLLPDADDT